MILHFRSRKFFELQAGLALLILGVLGGIVVRFFPALLTLIPPCMFRLWTGIPCPACGATSAGAHLGRFEIAAAIAASPLFVVLYLIMIVVAINSLIGVIWGKNLSLEITEREKTILRHVAAAAVLLNWLYLFIASIFN